MTEVKDLKTEIERYKKRLIRVSNIETYTEESAIKKATVIYKIATKLNELVREELGNVWD